MSGGKNKTKAKNNNSGGGGKESITSNNNNDENNDNENNNNSNSSSSRGSSGITSLVRSLFSISGAAWILMILYLYMAVSNIYRLMYPLSIVPDLSAVPSSKFVHPLWQKGVNMHMRLYLSTRQRFTFKHLQSQDNNDVAFLYDQDLTSSDSSFSKSLLLTTRRSYNNNNDDDDNDVDDDESYEFATSWLDDAERIHGENQESDGSIFSLMSGAGQGIESTSILITLYTSITKQIQSAVASIQSLLTKQPKEEQASSSSVSDDNVDKNNKRITIPLEKSSLIWKAIINNSTLYLHAVVLRHNTGASSNIDWNSHEEISPILQKATRGNSVLLGQVNMIKHDAPHHITKPKRILYHDLIFLLKKYLLFQDLPYAPWDIEYSMPKEFQTFQQMQSMKEHNVPYPYWKPEVSIKFVQDDTSYPIDIAHMSGMELVRVQQKQKQHPTGIAHMPALHVDEMGLTSDKYIPINTTVTALPLRLSFHRSDIMTEDDYDDGNTKNKILKKKKQQTTTAASSSTATSGPMSPARWRLLTHLSEGIEKQKSLGFEQQDIDDVKHIIANTNVTLLAITMFASALHLLFEFLTFKSEITFWNNNKDLTGLSVRSLFLDAIGQIIILLYLIEKDSSLLMTVPSAFGCLIALWKCHRAAGFQFIKTSSLTVDQRSNSWWNKIPQQLIGYELHATRLEMNQSSDKNLDNDDDDKNSSNNAKKGNDLTALTLESDKLATVILGKFFLLPLVLGYTVYSLLYEKHSGWYSYIITTLSSAVYALGFILMTPQLFLNYKLKSVAHLPWKVLIYRSLNTFIDDLFSFIIRMPTMARISCFRDDVVFIIYLYQRYLYPVDTSRPTEGGGDGEATSMDESSDESVNTTTMAKKKQ